MLVPRPLHGDANIPVNIPVAAIRMFGNSDGRPPCQSKTTCSGMNSTKGKML